VATLDDPHNTTPSEPDPFEGLVLDEDFVRGATHQEGSARARLLASKWQQEPPADTSWRPEPTPPRRWYERGPLRRRGVRRAALAVAVVAVLLLLASAGPGDVVGWISNHV